ncbi:MAG: AMP-binding protein, partial [Cytophagales bacterium]|nr:AMP-binding protein [Cytophagales bacterium]
MSRIPDRYKLEVGSPRPAGGPQTSTLVYVFGPDAVARVNQLADDDYGRFIVLTALFHLLLAKCSNADVSVIKTPLLAGDHPIDFFAREVALVIDSGACTSLRDLLTSVQATLEDSYAYQSFPVNVLAGKTLNLDFDDLTNVGLWTASIHREPPDASRFDLAVGLCFTDTLIRLEVSYNGSRFEPGAVRQLLGHFESLTACLADIEAPLRAVDFVGEAERSRLLHHSGLHAESPALSRTDLVTCLEQRAAEHPDRVALVAAEKTYTYRAFNETANRLARHLSARFGVEKGDLVGLYLPNSADSLVALFAVLKAGGAFVPLSVDTPAGPLKNILREAGVKVLITGAGCRADGFEGPTFAMEDSREYRAESPADGPGDRAPGDLAYVIYTSGSSGVPKGVEVTHQSLQNYVHWACTHYFRGTGSMAFFTPLAFDLTLTSVFCPVVLGKAIHVFAGDASVALPRIFKPGSGIDAVKLTPSHISMLQALEVPATTVRVVIAGGEALLPEQVQALKAMNPSLAVFNEYGPTEATVGCSVTEVRTAPVTIGKPIANARMYILDEGQRMLPVGFTGEIYIAGACLARGYFKRDEMTRARFLPDPFVPGATMY